MSMGPEYVNWVTKPGYMSYTTMALLLVIFVLLPYLFHRFIEKWIRDVLKGFGQE